EPRRTAYARLLTSNPQFARATVNYLWKEIFGLGIVEPADSFDLLRQDPATLAPGATLQPTHPNLVPRLGNYFVPNHYSPRAILRLMVQSNAYQLSSRYTPGPWNEAWTPYFARHYVQRLSAEELVDALAKATGVGNSFNVFLVATPITKAMKLPDTSEPSR